MSILHLKIKAKKKIKQEEVPASLDQIAKNREEDLKVGQNADEKNGKWALQQSHVNRSPEGGKDKQKRKTKGFVGRCARLLCPLILTCLALLPPSFGLHSTDG